MAANYPYVFAQGHITKTINQFRKNLPQIISSETLKKLAIASNNEFRVINVIKFLGITDDEGRTTEEAKKIFSLHNDEMFQKEFSTLLSSKYSTLFDLHQNNSWSLSTDELISFFRADDKTSERVGTAQAATFITLASFTGHRELQLGGSNHEKKSQKVVTKNKPVKALSEAKKNSSKDRPMNESDIGLTVRIEINLPSDAKQEIYDMIFKSIRENLMHG